ncbi:hypothetical protein QE327_gp027 [Pseudomonas phage Henu5]|uniref:Uncharacterized protein n=1 Tax=Pseudomonas phage Henu5 TaxID=2499902 RepID=A0A410T827_9CAUD|nr:hypothetical protein QE327_gp027 [Pseudomonas phage Henu5]QAU05060.1 hypothetical protein Henu5_gp29 [Pseudomonas phage Henu5]
MRWFGAKRLASLNSSSSCRRRRTEYLRYTASFQRLVIASFLILSREFPTYHCTIRRLISQSQASGPGQTEIGPRIHLLISARVLKPSDLILPSHP